MLSLKCFRDKYANDHKAVRDLGQGKTGSEVETWMAFN